MKKRLFAVTLIAVVAIVAFTMGIMPLNPLMSTVRADGEHAHCVCGITHVEDLGHDTEEILTYQPISTEEELHAITTAGNYYLSADITLSKSYEPVDGVVLCLNGKTITFKEEGSMNDNNTIFVVNENVTFTLTDCGAGKVAINGCSYKPASSGSSSVYMAGGVYVYGGCAFQRRLFSFVRNTAENRGGIHLHVDMVGHFDVHTAEHGGNGYGAIPFNDGAHKVTIHPAEHGGKGGTVKRFTGKVQVTARKNGGAFFRIFRRGQGRRRFVEKSAKQKTQTRFHDDKRNNQFSHKTPRDNILCAQKQNHADGHADKRAEFIPFGKEAHRARHDDK